VCVAVCFAVCAAVRVAVCAAVRVAVRVAVHAAVSVAACVAVSCSMLQSASHDSSLPVCNCMSISYVLQSCAAVT